MTHEKGHADYLACRVQVIRLEADNAVLQARVKRLEAENNAFRKALGVKPTEDVLLVL